MKKLWLIKSYFTYLMKAKSRYVIHSPFVFELLNKVLRDKTEYDDYALIDKIKREQSAREDIMETVDFGASAGESAYKTMMLRKGIIVKQRTAQKSQLELLYRLSKFLKPEVILELGTAAGISASYLKKGNPSSKLITLEGCANLADRSNHSPRLYWVITSNRHAKKLHVVSVVVFVPKSAPTICTFPNTLTP